MRREMKKSPLANHSYNAVTVSNQDLGRGRGRTNPRIARWAIASPELSFHVKAVHLIRHVNDILSE